MSNNKEVFKELYNRYISRDGSDKLLAYLEKSDFFTAPASTKYHLNREGGLVEHSINVFNRLYAEYENTYGDFNITPAIEESIAIVSLLHDLCKTNFYKVEYRNQKNEAGEWVKVPYYTVEDQLPYGHGEKSVYIASGFMRLTREEAMAIRWHMGGFDESAKGFSPALTAAFERYPMSLLLHIADMKASYLDEAGK